MVTNKSHILKQTCSFQLVTINVQAVEMKKILGRLVYQKILANLVSSIRRSFNWNPLKCPEIFNRVAVGNANS